MRLLGSAAAAAGLAGMVWEFAEWTAPSGSVSPGAFGAAFGVALIAWVILRRPPSGLGGVSRALWAAMHRTVVLMMPVMASCAVFVPYHDTKVAARGATMRSDLRNLADVQEGFERDSGRYLPVASGPYSSSFGVIGPDITLFDGGWTATVRHAASPQVCAIFMGTPPLWPATREGEPGCSRLAFDAVWFFVDLGLFMAGLIIATRASLPISRSGHAAQT